MNVSANGVKVLAFVVITGLLTAAVGVTMGSFRFDESISYRAVFHNVSGMSEGATVRAAGVDVGTVEDLVLRDAETVVVTFSVANAVPLTDTTQVRIHWKNLTGDRYLALTPGGRQGDPLSAGDVLPLANTRPAVDLDEVFNSFKPLLQGLSPKQVNQLSSSLIAVFQGQAGAVNSLLANVATFTSTLADRDKVIGSLIEKLNTVLGTVNERRDQFSNLIGRLQQVVSGLAEDRERIGDSLERTSRLAHTVTDFLKALRPQFQGAVRQTDRLASALKLDLATVDNILGRMPQLIQLTSRVGAYGSFFNFYLCGLSVRLTGPGEKPVAIPWLLDESPRCQFRKEQR